MRQILLSIIFILSASVTQAATHLDVSPAKVDIQGKNIILPGVEQDKAMQIYFIKNTSQQSLWLDHASERRAASAGWSSYLQPGQWSALFLNRKNFSVSCAVITPGKLEYQDCSKSVTVSIPAHFTYSSKRNGSYWLVEDKSWDDLLVALEKRGVKFK